MSIASLLSLRIIELPLRNTSFGLYSAGSAVSLIGMWMQRIAVGWLTWEPRSGDLHMAHHAGLLVFEDVAMEHPVARIVGHEGDAGAPARYQHHRVRATLRQVQPLDIEHLEGVAMQMDRVGAIRGVDQVEYIGLARRPGSVAALARRAPSRIIARREIGFEINDIRETSKKLTHQMMI